jgi:hypothetical protein
VERHSLIAGKFLYGPQKPIWPILPETAFQLLHREGTIYGAGFDCMISVQVFNHKPVAVRLRLHANSP